MSKPLDNLKGILIGNDKPSSDIKGKFNIHNRNYFVYGWLKEKEQVNEFGQKNLVKYFVLWATDGANQPSINLVKTDSKNAGWLSAIPREERETNKHPHYSGRIEINGNVNFLSAWRNKKEELINGEVVISIKYAVSIKPADNNHNHNNEDYSNIPNDDEYYDDVPF